MIESDNKVKGKKYVKLVIVTNTPILKCDIIYTYKLILIFNIYLYSIDVSIFNISILFSQLSNNLYKYD
jgi:hypothetical protein